MSDTTSPPIITEALVEKVARVLNPYWIALASRSHEPVEDSSLWDAIKALEARINDIEKGK